MLIKSFLLKSSYIFHHDISIFAASCSQGSELQFPMPEFVLHEINLAIGQPKVDSLRST